MTVDFNLFDSFFSHLFLSFYFCLIFGLCLSLSLSISHQFILYLYPSLPLSLSLFLFLLSLSIYLSVHLPVCRSLYLTVHLLISPSLTFLISLYPFDFYGLCVHLFIPIPFTIPILIPYFKHSILSANKSPSFYK